LDKWLIFLGQPCSRLLFSRFFQFFAEISKAAMRFRLLFTTICKRDALGWTPTDICRAPRAYNLS
jgi:hypothetical protein